MPIGIPLTLSYLFSDFFFHKIIFFPADNIFPFSNSNKRYKGPSEGIENSITFSNLCPLSKFNFRITISSNRPTQNLLYYFTLSYHPENYYIIKD